MPPDFWLTILFFLGLLPIAAVGLYPVCLALFPYLSRPATAKGGIQPQPPLSPSISFITVVHNGADLVPAKIANTQALDYPPDKLETIIYSDGSTDETDSLIGSHPEVRHLSNPQHCGKARGLNAAVAAAFGDVLVFSDADAILPPDALRKILTNHADSRVGGACGQRVIRQAYDDTIHTIGGQARYIGLDSRIKQWENRLGALTSNDGKLYWMRRELFTEVPDGVADDLFNCLTVVRQGQRFLFVPDAWAFIPAPARDAVHEIQRRRRIVCGSLLAIWRQRVLFHPRRHGGYGVRLGINKVLRRLLPFGLLLMLISSACLSMAVPFFWGVIFALQVGFIAVAALFPLLRKWRCIQGRPWQGLLAAAFYFCVGNLGMMLGVVDFIGGRRYVKWTPRKGVIDVNNPTPKTDIPKM